MTKSELQVAVAWEDLCRYLSACYYEPESAFEEEGMFEALLAAAKLAAPDLVPGAERLGQEFRGTSIDELLLDYSRLFIGPMQILAKPYGSVWLDEDKTLMGDSTMALLELYREADFEMDEEFKELPDHIAVELEFLYLLLFRENEARMINDEQKLSVFNKLRQRFLTQHLGAWIARFSAAVKEESQSNFYRELANLTEVFVKQQPSWVRM